MEKNNLLLVSVLFQFRACYLKKIFEAFEFWIHPLLVAPVHLLIHAVIPQPITWQQLQILQLQVNISVNVHIKHNSVEKCDIGDVKQ